LHRSQVDCNKITQKSERDRSGLESEFPSSERLRLRAKTRTLGDSDSTPLILSLSTYIRYHMMQC